MSIDLQRFCGGPDESREYMRKPFRIGPCVYATNGHVCVRVPADDVPDAAALDASVPIFEKAPALFTKWMPDSTFTALPELPPLALCHHCLGAGMHMARICDSCQGEGQFAHCGLTYDCQGCEGEPVDAGWLATDDETGVVGDTLKECRHCFGRGARPGMFQVGVPSWELAYLHWVAALPGVVACTRTVEDPMALRFDGGEALLMPRRY